MMVSVACDIALVLDDSGVIKNVAIGGGDPVATTTGQWVGQHWADTLTDDTRSKAQEFLSDLANTGVSRLRHLSHSAEGSDVPVAYAAVRLGEQGPTLAVGRDMRAVAAMQQRLMESQQEIERDYWHRRQAETRYRLLFQVATDPVLILDAMSFEVIDANRAASSLFARPLDQLIGGPIADVIQSDAHHALYDVLTTARTSGRVADGAATLADGLSRIDLSATPFASELSTILLVRARPSDGVSRIEAVPAEISYAELFKVVPDAVVICDFLGRIVLANPAFYQLVERPAEKPLTGRKLADWIGGPDGAFEDLLSNAKDAGAVKLHSARLVRKNGRCIDLEISAAILSSPPSLGLVIRIAHHQNSSSADASEREFH